MKIVAIVQARVRSTRLPAKVLLDLGGATALGRCLERVARIQGVNDILVATSQQEDDDLIVALANRLGHRTSRGSEDDVLDRFVQAAHLVHADAVVRLTSDCPLLDPDISGSVVQSFAKAPVAYASNTLERRLPRGLDTEIVSMEALEQAHRDARGREREHVTMHLYSNPNRFECRSVLPHLDRDLSQQRWTLDTLDDYRFLFKLFDLLGARASTASLHDVLAVIDQNPELLRINAHVTQKV